MLPDHFDDAGDGNLADEPEASALHPLQLKILEAVRANPGIRERRLVDRLSDATRSPPPHFDFHVMALWESGAVLRESSWGSGGVLLFATEDASFWIDHRIRALYLDWRLRRIALSIACRSRCTRRELELDVGLPTAVVAWKVWRLVRHDLVIVVAGRGRRELQASARLATWAERTRGMFNPGEPLDRQGDSRGADSRLG